MYKALLFMRIAFCQKVALMTLIVGSFSIEDKMDLKRVSDARSQ